MEVQRITRLVSGDHIFTSTGATILKVTHNGDEKLIELPIRSIGVADLLEDLAESTPRPPVKREFVKAKSDEGKILGLKSDKYVQHHDFTDEGYQAEIRKYNDDYRWRLVCHALDIELIDHDGNPITDMNKKKELLKQSGITGHHLDQIMSDVRALTQRAEEDADFLSGNDSE